MMYPLLVYITTGVDSPKKCIRSTCCNRISPWHHVQYIIMADKVSIIRNYQDKYNMKCFYVFHDQNIMLFTSSNSCLFQRYTCIKSLLIPSSQSELSSHPDNGINTDGQLPQTMSIYTELLV